MNQEPERSPQRTRLRGWATKIFAFVRWLLSFVTIPAPDPEELIGRVVVMERHIILPLKVAGIAMLLQRFYSSPWILEVSGILEIAIEGIQYFLWIYIGVNAVGACILLAMKRLPLPLIEWTVFVVSLVDGIFLGALTLATGGYRPGLTTRMPLRGARPLGNVGSSIVTSGSRLKVHDEIRDCGIDLLSGLQTRVGVPECLGVAG